MSIDCIIPCYNEATRVHEVLSKIVTITQLSQIICVDDGSTDETSDVVKKQFPTVKVITLSKNQGKAAAIQAGMLQSNADYLLLFDADLEKVKAEEIEKGIEAIQHDPRIDMLIFKRFDAPLLLRLIRMSTLLSGQRIVRRKLLEAFFIHPVKGFELEIKMNNYMMQHKKSVYWLPFSGQNNNLKIFKYGFFTGLKRELAACSDILLACSPFEYIKQWLLFCRHSLPLP